MKTLIVLDSLKRESNVGAIIRSAVAMGFSDIAVLGAIDPSSRAVQRASRGTIGKARVFRASWEGLAHLTGYGFVARGGIAPSCMKPGASLLAFGNEANGLTRQDLEPVTIPMANGVESMNVAASAAIAMALYRG